MDTSKIFQTESEVLRYIMELAKSDPFIPENARFRIRVYAAIAYGAAWEVSNRTNRKTHTQAVKMVNKDGREITRWDTIQQCAEELGYTRNAIYQCVRKHRSLKKLPYRNIYFEYINNSTKI